MGRPLIGPFGSLFADAAAGGGGAPEKGPQGADERAFTAPAAAA